MARYMLKVAYSTDGLSGVVKEGFAEREKYLKEFSAGMGVTFEAIYWALGDDDAFIIAEGPSANVIAGSLAASMSGTGRVTTVPLLTGAEMDEVRAQLPDFRKPGN